MRPPADHGETSASATPPAEPPAEPFYEDPIDFLMTIVNDPTATKTERVRAAIAAAGYRKQRPHDGGKKEERQEKADAVASGGRFTPSAPPKLARVA